MVLATLVCTQSDSSCLNDWSIGGCCCDGGFGSSLVGGDFGDSAVHWRVSSLVSYSGMGWTD